MRQESRPIGLLAAIGLGLLVAGLAIVGVVSGRRAAEEEAQTPAVKWRTLPARSAAPTETELKAGAIVAARKWIWDQYRLHVAEHALVTRYGSDLYVVTGGLQDGGQTKLYEVKLRWEKDSWILETIFVNGERWYGH
jgi:hypothetical protein